MADLRQPGERVRVTSGRPDWLTTVPADLDGVQEKPDFWAGYWENGLTSERLCAGHGTSMDGAFRAAVQRFSLQRLFDDAGLPEAVRAGIRTWRGAISAKP